MSDWTCVPDANEFLICQPDGRPVIRNAFVALEVLDDQGQLRRITPPGWWEAAAKAGVDGCQAFHNGPFTLEIRSVDQALRLQLHYTNSTDQPLEYMQRLVCLDGRWTGQPAAAVHNDGFFMPGEYRFRVHNNMIQTLNTSRLLHDDIVKSEEILGVEGTDGQHLVAGFATFARQWTHLQLTGQGALQAFCELENTTLAAGETLRSETLVLLEPADPVTGLAEHGEHVAALHRPMRFTESPVGWCTWYYYGSGTSNQQVMDDLAALAAARHELPVTYFQIDDGWQRSHGDWEANEKFSCSMKEIARRITEAGFVPALWLAPFWVDEAFARQHPQWVVRDDEDQPLRLQENRPAYALDVTHPEAAQWLADLIRRVTAEWGYRNLKLDFLMHGTMPGRRYELNITTAEAFHRGMKLIREAAGDDVYLLACTSPFGPAVGQVDAMRIGGDIYGDFDWVRNQCDKVLKRFFMHGRWFLVDPDILCVRDATSEDERCAIPCTRTLLENQTFATAIAANGGALMLSDRVNLLPAPQRASLRKVLPPPARPAVPLDLYRSRIPHLMDFGVHGNRRVIALFNWDDEAQELDVSPSALGLAGEVHVFDFWGGQYLGRRVDEGVWQFELPAHGALVLHLTPCNPEVPCVIGCDDHICQGPRLQRLPSDDEGGQQLLNMTLWRAPLTGQAVRCWMAAPAPPQPVDDTSSSACHIAADVYEVTMLQQTLKLLVPADRREVALHRNR